MDDARREARPQCGTLAVALGDSPAGLAAWIVEKLESWSDESAFTPDELLTWVTAYWLTGTIGTSFATYAEPVALPGRIDTPTVLSIFPRDTKPEPRSYAEAFLNVRDYVEHRCRWPLRRLGTTPRLRRRSTPRGQAGG
ncbi:hypothetical protein ABZT03_33825 [Streptomyces sp. NPDC005574]|uniref:hypothetical protein n=1 Tax=Streptomyces sp. NPDC005574 TaxID=3156891 RepID=UPI0033ACFF67